MTPETVPQPSSAVDATGGADPTADELPSLSPSRAADFKTCPLLFRFRSIDRLPELPTPEQARGTLVHAVLEALFDLPAGERTRQAATELVAPQWARLTADAPDLTSVLGDPTQAEAFLASTGPLLDGYFSVEDPRRLEPTARETLIETVVTGAAGPLRLRGYVDRLDTSPAGELRVVDYKSGGAPREAFEARALFQLKFYALVLWRLHGTLPKVLRLLYLKDAEACDYAPDPVELDRFQRTLFALWRAIEAATAAREFRPKPSRLCDWCRHQALCPVYGGTPPPFPERAPRAATVTVAVPEPRPGADD
ncbi:RecB family exonuclease [Natronosporangium hydrolyticum]|uniref:RecB family exonuclease n=1 Tax=Natronosporangium hydrolyticum TaxID=2811111 RepID=A0A895YB48_9ACTN|nr:RecB family exonuclease [Natronosporangium hydrolyticum]QSB12693.1 RecB family exonuclease [Natronosporangium hydrolyticum]